MHTTNELIEVVPAIQFSCIVNDKALTATLTHYEENYINYIYHVSFSNG